MNFDFQFDNFKFIPKSSKSEALLLDDFESNDLINKMGGRWFSKSFDTVVVSNKEVLEPAAVRYAWQANPDCNLYNSAKLPASPFRTDNWPGITISRK